MKQNIETLKEYFETGDKPTQQNYADLIDSLAMPMIGEIKAVSYGFAPQGWAKCNGQLLDPAAYPILFALIGTTYGGDGVNSFAVPNLVAKVPLGYGNTAGLSSYTIGQTGGEETTTLTEAQLPSHNHDIIINKSGTVSIPVNKTDGNQDTMDPSLGVLANSAQDIYASSPNDIYNGSPITVSGLDVGTQHTGNGTIINNLQPYLALNYIIAVEGINPM